MGQISSMTVPPYGHNFNHIIADFPGIVKRIMAKKHVISTKAAAIFPNPLPRGEGGPEGVGRGMRAETEKFLQVFRPTRRLVAEPW